MLYTRRGDDGSTTRFGSCERFTKDAPLCHALGSLDELNSWLGLCRAKAGSFTTPLHLAEELLQLQEHLFIIQAELAGADKHITKEHIGRLEAITAQIETLIKNPHAFVIPGTNELSALFDVARTIARRTERSVITAANEVTEITDQTKAYLNRLSSVLYAFARYSATLPGTHEPTPSY